MLAFFLSLFVFAIGLALSIYAVFVAQSLAMLAAAVVFMASFLALEFIFRLAKFLVSRKNRRHS
jgi:divalent metal cation (Fe/Co/Zn/Cd) transporter